MNRRRPTIKTQAGQETAAGQLEQFLLGDTTPARDWNTPLPQGRQRSLEELINHYGGVTQLANAICRHRSTVSSWRHHRQPSEKSNKLLDAIDRKISGHEEWTELVNRYGGIKPLAEHIGVTPATVRNWLNGRSQPHPANLAALQAADRHYRMKTTLTPEQEITQPEQTVLPIAEQPSASTEPLFNQKQWFLRASGTIRVSDGQGSPLYERSRNIGQGISSLDPRGLAIPATVVNDIIDAVSRNDHSSALDSLQQWLSTDYAQCHTYDPFNNIGFFIDQFDTFFLGP